MSDTFRRVLRVGITIVAIVVLLGVSAGALGQSPAAQSPKQPARSGGAAPINQSGRDKTSVAGTPCVFDFERGEVPDCIGASPKGELFVEPRYLKELSFDSQGLAAVLSNKEGWMYINRRGRVVISGVPVMDNGADWFHDGLVRIVRNDKYGFANRKGQVVIPPIYDGALNFEKGRATVCKGCKSACAEPDCEYHSFKGGQWFQINTKGTVLNRLRPVE
jgi:hypothetical protein